MATASRWVIISSLQIIVEKEITLRVEIFVYGTLKRGFGNHTRFCEGVLHVEEATVRGRLHELSSGYPALAIPEEDVRAVGTADYLADTERQQHLNKTRPAKPIDTPGEWDTVSGELLAFDDPEERLPALDGLEGFDPCGGHSLYRRVLVLAQLTENRKPTLAWVYVADNPSGVYLPGGWWPEA